MIKPVKDGMVFELPGAGTAKVKVKVGRRVHDLEADLALFEDAEWMHEFLGLAGELRDMRDSRPDGDEGFESFVTIVEKTRELHPKVVGMIEDVFGVDVYAQLFGEARKPMMRGVMLLMQFEPLVAKAYDEMFAGWLPDSK